MSRERELVRAHMVVHARSDPETVDGAPSRGFAYSDCRFWRHQQVARAPWAVSSPGWNTAITVPRHVLRFSDEDSSCSHQPNNVHVMTAGVRDRCGLAEPVGACAVARIRQAGALLDRQRIHVGTQ